MPAKTFVFRMSWGKFEGTAIINYTQADIDLMQECINKEKASGTIFISTSQITGNPYATMAPKDDDSHNDRQPTPRTENRKVSNAKAETNAAPATTQPDERYEDTGDELPF